MNRFSLELDRQQSAAAQDRNNACARYQRTNEMRSACARTGSSDHTTSVLWRLWRMFSRVTEVPGKASLETRGTSFRCRLRMLGFIGGQLLLPTTIRTAELRVSRTCYQVIVDHACRLHERVANRRTNKFESTSQ